MSPKPDKDVARRETCGPIPPMSRNVNPSQDDRLTPTPHRSRIAQGDSGSYTKEGKAL
jgi:hypothetical protein